MEQVQGWSEAGGTSVVVPGTQGSGSQRFQQSFRGCTVTVRDSSNNLATIYSDDLASPTAKANPFTSSSTTGSWSFFITPGTYSVTFSGGSITAPFSITVNVGLGNAGGVPSYAFASLPTSKTQNAGDLARVTNNIGGLWMDGGTQWAKVFPVLNVKDAPFNATGNGTTDDTTAFSSALTALTALGGGQLFVPVGIYNITSTLTIPTAGTQIVGTGAASQIKWTGGGSACFNITQGSVAIRDLRIFGTDVASEVGIQIANGCNAWVLLSRIETQTLRTHYLINGGTFFHSIYSPNIIIKGSQIGIDIVTNSNDINIIAPCIRGFAANGGAVSDTDIGVRITASSDIQIVGGTIEGIPGGNIVLLGACSGINITCHLETWGANALDIDISATSKVVNIKGCVITDSTTPSAYSIRIRDGAQYVNLVGNRADGFGTAWILNDTTSGFATANISLNQNRVIGTIITSYTGVNNRSDSGLNFFANMSIGTQLTTFLFYLLSSVANDVIGKIKNSSVTGYGLIMGIGVDDTSHYILDLQNSSDVSKHTFYGGGRFRLAQSDTTSTSTIGGLALQTDTRIQPALLNAASANDLTLGVSNTFNITGNTQINTIIGTGWRGGSIVTFIFASNPVVAHNTAGAGARIFLAGSANFNASSLDTLTLLFDDVEWVEVCRSVN